VTGQVCTAMHPAGKRSSRWLTGEAGDDRENQGLGLGGPGCGREGEEGVWEVETGSVAEGGGSMACQLLLLAVVWVHGGSETPSEIAAFVPTY
jgi:hypothetical protein